jgi:Stress responsive A/B Barrel Domain
LIAHIILFKPRSDMSPEERKSVLDALASAAVDIPMIRSFRIGRRVRHGRPGYEQMMREDFEYAVIIEFDDVDGLTAYLAHSEHAAIGAHFTQSAAGALAYDYEMVDLRAT